MVWDEKINFVIFTSFSSSEFVLFKYSVILLVKLCHDALHKYKLLK
jgi:hypothetical protein